MDGLLIHHLGQTAILVQFTLLRGIGAAVLVACLARKVSVLRTSQPFSQMFRGLLTVSSLWLIFYSFAELPLADATAINYLCPIFIALFGAMLLAEVVTSRRWLATGVSLCGALVVIGPAFSTWESAYVAALAGAAMNAGAVAATKFLAKRDSATTILAYLALTSIVFSLPALAQPWPWQSWIALLAVAASGAFGLWLSLLAIQATDTSLLAPFEYIRIPFTILFALILFGETPSIWTWIGSTVILLSGPLLLVREPRLNRVREA